MTDKAINNNGISSLLKMSDRGDCVELINRVFVYPGQPLWSKGLKAVLNLLTPVELFNRFGNAKNS